MKLSAFKKTEHFGLNSTLKLALFTACAVGFFLPLQLQAQTFPSKPITLVIPFVPGGTTDILGRILADGLGKKFGQTVVVDNRGGAGGNIGAAAVAQSKPDGYTLLLGYNGTNAINPSLYKQLPWDPIKSFDPISMVARVNNVVVINPNLAIKTLPELVTYANANPGKLNYGSAGAGSIFHLAGEMLEQQAHITLTHVPYKGASPAVIDLMGGQIQLMFSTIPAVLQQIKSGKLRAIGVTGAQRSPLFPELPTAKESGYSGMMVDSWFGVFAPKGTPKLIEAQLNTAIREVLNDPIYIKKMEDQGAQPLGSTANEMADLLASDLKVWQGIIRSAKVVLE